MAAQRSERLPSGYLSPSSQTDLSGRSDMLERVNEARRGSDRLLAAILRYYERTCQQK